MSKEEILEGLKRAIIALDDQEVNRLIKDGLQAQLSPTEMITEGLIPGLTTVRQGFQSGQVFMTDWIVADQILNDAMDMLLPLIEAGGEQRGEVMVIGTVEGDPHKVGKRSVSRVFAGAGYRVIDLGESVPASKFVEAVKEHKASIVAASATKITNKVYCQVINRALVDAGIRESVIYIIGGQGMTQEWSDISGADCYGEDALDALNKVKLIRQRKGM